jgi:hypothetical protein
VCYVFVGGELPESTGVMQHGRFYTLHVCVASI